jgi:proline dehydrogenase
MMILPTREETHQNYHRVVEFMLSNIDTCNIMIASHNKRTIGFVTERMSSLGIGKNGIQSGVSFAQLLGMSDHVSYSLALDGYTVKKYLPYGPVNMVIPYLLRRAHENTGLLSGSTEDRQLLWQELVRRKFGFWSK